MKAILQLIDSKKAVIAVCGVLATLLARVGLSVDPASLAVIVTPVLMYIYSQGKIDEQQPPAA